MSPFKNKTILLVEDEYIIAMVEIQLLKKEGYRVIHVGSGEDAIEFFQNEKEPADIILMDINLGKGMDGTEAAEIILRDHDIPLLFLSSHTEPEIVAKTEKITSYGYVVKNSGETVLFTSIKMAFKLFEAKKNVQIHEQQLEATINQLEDSNQDLLLSEEKYRALVELSPYMILIHQKGIIRYINKAGAAMVGFANPEEMVGKSLFEFIPPQYHEVAQERINSALAQGGQTPVLEQKIKTVSGQEIDLEVMGISLWFENEPAIQVIGHDITEQKRIEERKKIEEVTFNLLLELHQQTSLSMPELFDFILEATLKITMSEFSFTGLMNEDESVMSIHAWSNGAMQQCCITETPMHFPIQQAGIWGECVRQRKPVIFNDYTEEIPTKRGIPEGHVRINRFMGVPVFDGKRIVAVGAVANKTAPYELADAQNLLMIYEKMWAIIWRKKSEETLRQQYDYLWTMMDAIPNPIFYKNIEGQYTGCNRAFEEYIGTKREDIIGKTVFDLSPPELAAKYLEKDQELLNTPGQQHFEWKVKRGDGEIRDVIFDKASVFDAQKQYQGIIGVIRDITALKKVEWRNQLMNEILARLNLSQEVQETIRDILHIIKKNTAIEAVGIRLGTGEDYPYYETNGFPAHFVEAEDFLCLRDESGAIKLDETGKPVLTCMCGTVLAGLTSPSMPFFTAGGSFWSNNTTELLAATTATGRGAQARNRCNGEGYESVALIPLRADQKIIGLLQFNDHRTNQFTLDKIEFFESIGASIGIAFSRMRVEEKIKTLLAEKETLLQEVHHRIKNNMNTIYSLLRLQSHAQVEPTAGAILQDAASRVKSMMILYEKLYRSENKNEISLQDYFPPLINEIMSIYADGQVVAIQTEIGDIKLAPKVLSPLGIIINELVSNAMKYAFTNTEDACIRVTATEQDDRVSIIFADNGSGIPEKVMIGNRSGFGITLIDMLIKQINGSVSIQRHKGTTFVLDFPVIKEPIQ